MVSLIEIGKNGPRYDFALSYVSQKADEPVLCQLNVLLVTVISRV